MQMCANSASDVDYIEHIGGENVSLYSSAYEDADQNDNTKDDPNE